MELNVWNLICDPRKGPDSNVQSLVPVQGSRIRYQEPAAISVSRARRKYVWIGIIADGGAPLAPDGTRYQAFVPQMICNNSVVGEGGRALLHQHQAFEQKRVVPHPELAGIQLR